MINISENQYCNDKYLYDNHHLLEYLKNMETLDAEKLQKLFSEYVDSTENSINAIAKRLGVQQASLQRYYQKKQQSLSYDVSVKILSMLGYSIQKTASKDTAHEVCFVDAKIVSSGEGAPHPKSEEYLAVPLVGEEEAGYGSIPSNSVDIWVLVYRKHRSAVDRSNLLAVEIGQDQRSMVPTLHPLDIILVDRDDWGKNTGYRPPGNIFLVRKPGKEVGGMVRRVSLSDKRDIISFYSDDSAAYGPDVYHMSQYNNDIRNAIIGRVVWAWTDLSRK